MRGNKAGLADLKRLHKALEARAQAEQARLEEARAQAAEAARKANQDGQSFRQAMRAVTPLKSSARVVHAAAPVADEAVSLRRAGAVAEPARRADAGVSDGGVAHLLSENGTAFVRSDAAPDTARKLKRGHWRAGAELDLHGLRVEQARHAMLAFLDECLEHGIRCLRIVHGKGYGSEGMTPVLRDKARAWLVQKAEVAAFSEAPEREGGSGALLVLLRQSEDGSS